MENTFEVEVLTYVGNHVEGETLIDDYQWNTEYSGDDHKKAFQALADLKDNGAKRARITWR